MTKCPHLIDVECLDIRSCTDVSCFPSIALANASQATMICPGESFWLLEGIDYNNEGTTLVCVVFRWSSNEPKYALDNYLYDEVDEINPGTDTDSHQREHKIHIPR